MATTVRTATAAPTRKALAGGGGAGLGDALADIFIWALEGAGRFDVPDRIEGAFHLVFIVGLAVFAAWLMPPAVDEGVVVEHKPTQE